MSAAQLWLVNQSHTGFAIPIDHHEAPAVSIARNKRAIQQASSGASLLGKSQSNCDQNATRDVTNMLIKSGMAMRVERTNLVTGHSLWLQDGFFKLVMVVSASQTQSYWDSWAELFGLNVSSQQTVLPIFAPTF